ncbi:MAG TPA: class I SAM-dependent methyltransferase [Candidatus Methanoperedens sp.]
MEKKLTFPPWQYDEMQQVGTDYTEAANVETYDGQMQKLRDVNEETEAIIKSIDLKKNETILEIGTGTGSFAIEAARHCAKVIAIDVSPKMLEFARQKARLMGTTNIEFYHAGFLTYDHKGIPLDAVVSQLALHHLPDFWKIIALRRIFEMLKSGGKFYLMDSVYSFDFDDHKNFFDNLIDRIRDNFGVELACDFEIATREEYTTLDWIMEGLLRRAGFYIDKAEYSEGFMAVYVCTKRINER